MISVIAPAVFCLYLAGCFLFGNRFPFSKFELYAEAANRDAGAVPVFFADGHEAKIWEYTGFQGLDPSGFLPADIPTSLTWMVEEAQRWVQEHASAEEAGPVKVAFGFRVLRIGADNLIEEEVRILQEGSAWMLD